MKVRDIITERNSAPNGIQHVKVNHLPNLEDSNEQIGSGYEAKVYAGKDGGTVIKEVLLKGSPEESGIYNYINMVLQNQDNPFFPRIYNAKLYTHKTMGRHKLVVQMEKLTDFNSAKTEHLLPQLLDQMGIDIQDVAGRSKYRSNQLSSGNYGEEPTKPDDEQAAFKRNAERKETLGDYGDVMFQRFRTPEGRAELMRTVKNPKLKQAIQATDKILNKAADRFDSDGGRKTTADLHDANVMLRLTNHGPQLVITDPMADFQD